ncbi:hypothetical protein [Haladaptatus sp. CMAA 1911]|uniref:hypothetical protein n=1 Tax=unclassified Haladaptatus TaxID=2622732 RepID=UPI0037543EAA
MTDETDIEIDSSDRFTAVLEAALAAAHRNDIDVEGGWLIESPSSDVPNWDVEIWQTGE